MHNYEESAKSYENDYRFAPVGMAVGSFWGGALLAGLTAFAMSTFIAKGVGFVQPTIFHNERLLFTNDTIGLQDGFIIAFVLLALSICVGVVGRLATLNKRDLHGLWRFALIGVPIFTLLFTITVITLRH